MVWPEIVLKNNKRSKNLLFRCHFLEDFACCSHGGRNIFVRVRGTYEAGFIERRGNVDAPIKQPVEELVEAARIAFHDLGVVLGQLRQQEKSEHATLAIDRKGQALCVSRILQSVDQQACLA